MAQLLMGLPRQQFRQSSSFPGAGENDPASQLFDQFCSANTFHGIMDTFQRLCDVIGLHPVDHQIFYKQLKTRLLSWKAQTLWNKLDKRAANMEYKKGTACNKTRALVIGAGPCGLRIAIEIALLGGKAVIVEKREGFSRNNVLHLWPFLIHDLKALGAKKFFGKFCAGAIDHISIRTLQCILLKVALLVGVEVHSGVAFEGFSEPPPDQTKDKVGWRAKATPPEHPLAEFEFDVCISSDGKRNTMTEFKRKEFRGKLAIAITANFINRNTQAEASVQEISGVAYIFNQKFFKDLNHYAGIDLENIVYYKDETHYFVMTAKKQSLLCKGVLLQDYDDPEVLLSKENVDQNALLEYARQAADMSTQHRLPNLEFAHNHYGQPDVAMFDFTSMFAAEHACRVVERHGYRLLVGLVGDTLLEPFWPTGSGCARGFLGAFDAAWMIRSWASGKMTPLEVIAERESIYQLLSQTTPENLNKNCLQYSIDPNTRYMNLNLQFYKPHQVAMQYDGHDIEYLNEIVKQAAKQSNRYDYMRDSHNLLKWIQRQLENYQSIVRVVDLSSSWHSGMALCALIHHYRPALIDFYSLDPNRVAANNQLAFDVIEKEFGISPIMTGQELAQCEVPDRAALTNYLSRICSFLRKEGAMAAKSSEDKETNSKCKPASLKTRSGQTGQQREEESDSLKQFQDPLAFCDVPSKRAKVLYDGNSALNALGTYDDLSKFTKLQKELQLLSSGVRGQNKVSVLAKDLASKLGGETGRPSVDAAEVCGKPQASDTCHFCKNRMYTVERYTAEGLIFHRGCFRCDYCGTPLRISYYSFKASADGEGKFYCVQHHGLLRKNQAVTGQTAASASSKGTTGTKYPVSQQKLSSVTESCLRYPTKETTTVKKTAERVEYVTESEVEESEYEQTKHNLCSVLRPSAYSDSDSSSSEEELHFSDEEASDEQPDLSWAELARKYNEQLRQTKAARRPPQKRTSSASSGSETETIEGASDADWETDSNTDKENADEENGHPVAATRTFNEKHRNSRDAFSKNLLSLSPKQSIWQETKPSPTSVEIMRNRMAFFSTVCQPVRIDARTFLGLAQPPADEEASKLNQEDQMIDENQSKIESKDEDKQDMEKKREEEEMINNRTEVKPSKRHVEKKPVIQKAKKRTKRRKKDEKSRVTADVESTKLSVMHEAVPVVSVSGPTSSDEQDGRIDLEIKEENAVKKTTAESEEEEKGRGRLEEKVQKVLEGKRSAEEGRGQPKSAGSPGSENSETLQYSDTDEQLSGHGEVLSGGSMSDGKRPESVEMLDGRSIVLGSYKDDPDQSSVQKTSDETPSDFDDLKAVENIGGVESELNGSEEVFNRLVKNYEEPDKTGEDQTLEHEYVVLEEGVADAEIGKFSPYEELVTDGSDKEYTKIQMPSIVMDYMDAEQPLSCREKRVKSSKGNDDKLLVMDSQDETDTVVVKEFVRSEIEDDSPATGASLKSDDVFDAGKLRIPSHAPTAESESFSDEEGGRPGSFVGTTGIVQNHLKEKSMTDMKVPLEENIPAWNEAVETIKDLEERETWPVKTEEVVDEANIPQSLRSAVIIDHKQNLMKAALEENIPAWTEVVENLETMDKGQAVVLKMDVMDEIKFHQGSCHALKHEPIKEQRQVDGEKKSAQIMDAGSSVDREAEGQRSEKEALDPLSRINLLLESLSANKSGLLANDKDTGEYAMEEAAAETRPTDAKKERPSSLVVEDELKIGGESVQVKSLNLKDKKRQKPAEISSDSSTCNASSTSGSVDYASSLARELTHGTEQLTSPTDESISDGRQGTSLRYDDGSSIDQLATGSLSEDVLSLENAVEVNIEGEELDNLEVEVWPRVILENKTVGDQALTKRLETEVNECLDSPQVKETSEMKTDVANAAAQVEGLVLLTAADVDQRSVSQGSNGSASSVLSPNRLIDAKRRFFFEPPQPVRIDPRRVFKDIPSTRQDVAREISGEESSVISGEFDSDSKSRLTTSTATEPSVLSSGSDTGVEKESLVSSSSEVRSAPLSREQIVPVIPQEEIKRVLPSVSTSQSPQPSLPGKSSNAGAKPSGFQKAGSDRVKGQVPEGDTKSKRLLFKEKKRPNSAFIVMEDNWRSKTRASPIGTSRPTSAKPVPHQPGQKVGSPVIRAEGVSPLVHASQSDGASAEEASPSLPHKDKENRLKGFYQQKTKSKEPTPLPPKELQDKKDKKKSLLALFIPSRSLDKKDKSPKSPVLQSKNRTPEGASKLPVASTSMAVVREKTKSLPLEKKQVPAPVTHEPKKTAGEKLFLKGKLKSKVAKPAEEPVLDVGHSIYKEMAGIMEGIKKVEKRNRDKISIKERIEAVAPPPAKAPNTSLLPPKADIEDFETESELGDDRLSLRSFQSQMHLLSEEDAAKMKKKQQKAARRKQREKELKRLHAAQEIQQQLEEVEMRQREIERLGVEIEKALHGEKADESRDESSLVQQWFDIVYERNILARYESELMVQARELELEDRQSRLEIQLRERIPQADSLREDEQRILQELMEVVEQRDALVALLEEDRIRQQQYNKNLERIMVDRGFQLSPISHLHLPQALASLQEDR